MTHPEHKAKRSWGIALFGWVFVLAGLWVFGTTAGTMIVGYVASNDWVEVPAEIHSLNLNRNNTGDDTTYSISSSYSYRFKDRRYTSQRVSLSTGSDNLGRYWHDLFDDLRRAKNTNEAVAIINPDNPSQAFLDRTFRWGELLFGFAFLLAFGGVGSFVVWSALNASANANNYAQYDATQGIKSQEKSKRWFLAGFGGVIFSMGAVFSIIAIPEAIKDGEYLALFTLIFVVIGGIILKLAWTEWQAYRRYGPTPLFLDPTDPGIGGQFGARFNLNLSELTHASNPLTAKLTCTRVSKSGKSTRRDIKWQEDAPVYIKQTATGLEGSTLFDIPADCRASKAWKRRSAIEWTLHISGDFNTQGLGDFKRTWSVYIADDASEDSSSIHLPESYVEEFDERSEKHARASAITQIEVTEQSGTVGIKSKAGRYKGQHFIAMAIGAGFAAAGVLTLGEWFGAYLFMAIGILTVALSIYALGSGVNATVDKATQSIRVQYSWFGMVYKTHEATLYEPSQITIKKTSHTQSGDAVTEYYAVHAIVEGKKRTIAKGIEGRDVATALQDVLIEKCFDKPRYSVAT